MYYQKRTRNPSPPNPSQPRIKCSIPSSLPLELMTRRRTDGSGSRTKMGEDRGLSWRSVSIDPRINLIVHIRLDFASYDTWVLFNFFVIILATTPSIASSGSIFEWVCRGLLIIGREKNTLSSHYLELFISSYFQNIGQETSFNYYLLINTPNIFCG